MRTGFNAANPNTIPEATQQDTIATKTCTVASSQQVAEHSFGNLRRALTKSLQDGHFVGCHATVRSSRLRVFLWLRDGIVTNDAPQTLRRAISLLFRVGLRWPQIVAVDRGDALKQRHEEAMSYSTAANVVLLKACLMAGRGGEERFLLRRWRKDSYFPACLVTGMVRLRESSLRRIGSTCISYNRVSRNS